MTPRPAGKVRRDRRAALLPAVGPALLLAVALAANVAGAAGTADAGDARQAGDAGGVASAGGALEPAAGAVTDSLDCVLADWEAGALGGLAAGLAAWVQGPDGALRVDLTIDQDSSMPADPRALLAQEGQGWTFVAGGSGDALYGSWGREWRPAPAGWVDLARAVAATAAPAAAAAGSRHLVLAAPAGEPAAAGEPGAGSSPDAFRVSLARRGRGGGGPGERVQVSPAAGGAARVTSSRRPGAVLVRPRSRRAAVGDAAEVFLPWWPLGQVLRFAGGAGTSGDSRR